jgi:hypothetical protein
MQHTPRHDGTVPSQGDEWLCKMASQQVVATFHLQQQLLQACIATPSNWYQYFHQITCNVSVSTAIGSKKLLAGTAHSMLPDSKVECARAFGHCRLL